MNTITNYNTLYIEGILLVAYYRNIVYNTTILLVLNII